MNREVSKKIETASYTAHLAANLMVKADKRSSVAPGGAETSDWVLFCTSLAEQLKGRLLPSCLPRRGR
jgi:hypothetical protein